MKWFLALFLVWSCECFENSRMVYEGSGPTYRTYGPEQLLAERMTELSKQGVTDFKVSGTCLYWGAEPKAKGRKKK